MLAESVVSHIFIPSRSAAEADQALASLILTGCDTGAFASEIQRLKRQFGTYLRFCSPPWAAPRLLFSAEDVRQSELWLSLDEIRPPFYRFLRSRLRFPTVFSSTPFETSSCWFEMVAHFPPWLARYTNPATLLSALVSDSMFCCRFIFWLFMPDRYYGSSGNRYPRQMNDIRNWLQTKQNSTNTITCLDAACGDGSGTCHLATELLLMGYRADQLRIEGWTLHPLEVWSAAYGIFMNDMQRQQRFINETDFLFSVGAETSISFRSYDLLQLQPQSPGQQFDLVLCNGLLGGPIIHHMDELTRVVSTLAKRLRSGGLLVAADHFHEGWKKQYPDTMLIGILANCGLTPVAIEEGIAGIKTGNS